MSELFPSPPVDLLTHDICMRHGLVEVPDLEARVYRLRDTETISYRGGRSATYVLAAEELPRPLWYCGIPLIEVRLTGHQGPYVLVGRMDVCDVEWSVDPDWPPGQAMWTDVRYALNARPDMDHVQKLYYPGTPVRPGLMRVREKTRGWRNWARNLSFRIEAYRPRWDEYLAWMAARNEAAVMSEVAAGTDSLDEAYAAGDFDGF